MSTPFYDLASLVVVPSGYKASKVYAQKPLTTDGQLTFSRASTATRVNASGLIETVSSNVPRLDYLGSSCPRLLLEPQRTNLALDSETISAGTGATVSLNSATSPDGTANADKLVEDTSTGAHQTSFATSLGGSVDSSAYCISIFAKAAGRSRILFYDNNQNTSGVTTFDLSSGTILSGGGKIENYGNGWYRCTIFPIKNFSTTSSVFIQLISTGTTTSYTGDGTSGVLFWGKQVEYGSYATSYVKTEAATVTRLADACSKTGISSLIGQTEGTLFLEMNINKRVDLGGSGPNGLEIKDASGSNVIMIGTAYSTNQIFSVSRRNSGSFSTLLSTTNNALGTYKLAAAYSSAGFVFYINGVQIGTSATLPPSATFADIGLSQVFGSTNVQGELVNQALLFKTRLTNAQLAELTAL